LKTRDRSYNVGLMKQRGTFEYYTTTTDSIGGTSQTWTTLASAWLDIKPQSGREALETGALRGNVKYKIVTRYRDDFVTAGYNRETYDYLLRLKYDGKIFNIEYAIDKGEEKTYTELIAVQEVGDET